MGETTMEPTEVGPVQAGPVLQVELDASDDTCRLTLRGDLCQTSVAALQAQVDQLGCLPCQEVLVDLRSLTGLDEVGAKLLLGLYHYVLARGGAFRVSEARPEVAGILQSVAGTVIPVETLLSSPPLALNALSTRWNAP